MEKAGKMPKEVHSMVDVVGVSQSVWICCSCDSAVS